MADLDKAVAQTIEAYKSAVQAKDVDAFMRLYDPGVRVFDTWGVWAHEGAAAWRGAVDGWFTSLGTESVQVSFQDLKATVTRDLAAVSATVTYAGISARGEPLRTLQNRLSWMLRTSGHVLRIFHEHTSAPVGFEDLKAILQRPDPQAPATRAGRSA